MKKYFKNLKILIGFSIICIIIGAVALAAGIILITFSIILAFSTNITTVISRNSKEAMDFVK